MDNKATVVKCYQCLEKDSAGPGLFPFCSLECKEKYGVEHFGPAREKKRVKSIREIQDKLMEIKKELFENKEKNNDVNYDVVKEIFG